MKEYTKYVKTEFSKDFDRVNTGTAVWNQSNSFLKKTVEQRRQSRMDVARYYTKKWNDLLQQSTTTAQKGYCKRIIALIDKNMAEPEGRCYQINL